VKPLQAVLSTSGHKLIEDSAIVVLKSDLMPLGESSPPKKHSRGTGCTLSSAFAAQLARGLPLTEAARAAKAYINNAIIHGAAYKIGNGHGPVCHFYNR